MRQGDQRFRLIQGSKQREPKAQEALLTGPQKALPSNTAPAPSSPNLAQALRASEQRLSALLQDRGQIGRDLHDCVLQSLYAIGLSLEQSRRLSATVAQPHRSSGMEAVAQLNALIHDIRRMITGLERGTVEEFDLPTELRRLVDTYTQVGRLQIALKLQPAAVEILTGEEEREILNIIREALSNCARHAGATQARIVLKTRGTRVRLTIDDNGTGFDLSKDRVGGYGLANMAARAKKLGGQLTIRSHIGRGTKIMAEFALDPVLTPV